MRAIERLHSTKLFIKEVKGVIGELNNLMLLGDPGLNKIVLCFIHLFSSKLYMHIDRSTQRR